MAGIFAILALSLNLLLGYTGQLSLGHAAFFGIGAYTSALLALKLEWSFWLGAARRRALAAGLAGWAHRPPRAQAARRVLRAGHHQLRRRDLAGERELDGADQRPARPARRAGAGARRASASAPSRAYYYLVLVADGRSPTSCAIASCARAWAAPSWRSARTRRWPSRSASTPCAHWSLAAVVSAAMAGVAGSLYAHYTRFVSPEVFLFSYTVTMVIMVVAGGKGTLAGPVVGARALHGAARGAARGHGLAVADARLRRAARAARLLPAARHRAATAAARGDASRRGSRRRLRRRRRAGRRVVRGAARARSRA